MPADCCRVALYSFIFVNIQKPKAFLFMIYKVYYSGVICTFK